MARGGIDLGGTKIQAVVVDGRHRVLGEARRPTPSEGGPTQVAAEMVTAIQGACEAAGVEPGDLSMIGVGSPGAVDAVTGTVANAKNLPDWNAPFPLGKTLHEALGAPVAVGNDVGTAVIAEAKLGEGKGRASMLGVWWGTGVGGGLVLAGKPWHGQGSAGEIGHMVVKRNGAHCPCGRNGCMEAYAGRAAMEARARKLHRKGRQTDLFKIAEHKGKPRLTSGVWAKAIKHGDELAIELIDRAVEALGVGVASAVNLLDPEVVVLGGGLGVRFGKPMAERILDAMMPHLFSDDRPPVVAVSSLGDLGGALGGTLLEAPNP